MAMSAQDVKLRVIGEDAASQALRKVMGTLKDIDRSVGALQKGFGNLAIGSLAYMGISRLNDFMRESVRMAGESDDAMAKVQAVIAATGGAAGFTASQLSGMASEMQRSTRFEDDAILEMEARLLTFRNVSGEVFETATRAGLDMATVMGTDLNAAAIQLGKALNDPINGITALTRVGVSFTDQQKAQIKALQESGDLIGAQRIILQELSGEFGGAAAAAAETYAGKMEQVQHRMGDVQEEIGKALMANGEFISSIESLAATIEKNSTGIVNAFIAIGNAASWAIERLSNYGNAAALFGLWKDGKITFGEYATAGPDRARQLINRESDTNASRTGAEQPAGPKQSLANDPRYTPRSSVNGVRSGGKGSQRSGHSSGASAAETAEKKIRKVMGSLEQERLQLTASEDEWRAYEMIQRAGVSQGSSVASSIRTKVRALSDLKDQQEQVTSLSRVMLDLDDRYRQATMSSREYEVTALINQAGVDETSAAADMIRQRFKEIEDAGNSLYKNLQNGAAQWVDSLSGSLAEMVVTAKFDFGSILQSFEKMILEMVIRTQIMKPLENWISSVKFASGGVMTSSGPVPLRRYASGGIARSPQLALYGEGSMAEAYVPLPDGRSIPVDWRGGRQASAGLQNVKIEIVNQGSESLQVESATPRADAEGYIISVVTKAARTNKYGMRDILTGGR